jgi:hypothetical protein
MNPQPTLSRDPLSANAAKGDLNHRDTKETREGKTPERASRKVAFTGFIITQTNPFLMASCLCVGLGLLFLSSPAWAGLGGGQRPAAYLQYGIGGAQSAMAGAAVAGRNDVACGFWNPAGLTGIRGFQVEDQWMFLPQNQVLNFFSLAKDYRNRFFYGLSWILYSAGSDLEARQAPTTEPDSVFSDLEMTFLVHLAYRLNPRWSIGANIKLFTLAMESLSGYGFGEDFSFQYRFTPDTTLGVMFQDPYSALSYSDTSNAVFPPTIKAGLSHRNKEWAATGNFDLEWSSDLGVRPRWGVEWRPMNQIAIRGGLWLGNLTTGAALTPNVTAGLGILVPLSGSLMEFGYTILPDRVLPGNFLHQITLAAKFY